MPCCCARPPTSSTSFITVNGNEYTYIFGCLLLLYVFNLILLGRKRLMNFKQFQQFSIAIIAFHEFVDAIAAEQSQNGLGKFELVNVKTTVGTTAK